MVFICLCGCVFTLTIPNYFPPALKEIVPKEGSVNLQ